MLVNGAWLAAPPVRSVAPRLRDPCASVRRRTGGVDGVCRHQFLLAWAAGSASRFLVRDAYGRNYMACQCVFWVVLGTFANPVLESLLETAFGKQDVRYSVQLRITAARARERAAFEPAEPCCKRRGAWRAPRPATPLARQQAARRSLTPSTLRQLGRACGTPPVTAADVCTREKRRRRKGVHSLTRFVPQADEQQHGRTSRRRKRRRTRRPRRLRPRQRWTRARPGPRPRARPWRRRVSTRADII